MSKDHKILPKLRFPEFESDGEFREKSLGYFCDYWNGSGNESGVTEDGQYLLISLNSIDIEGNLKSDMKRVPSTDNSLKKGDLVMVLSDVAHGNFLGLSAIIPDDNYVLNQRMAGLGIKDFSEIDPKYLRLFINGNQKYFKRQGQGSSQQNLSKGSVIDFPVLVPTRLIEQQKIASCLSSLDELLAAHKDKLDALKDHKKGLLQNLFPQEGETVPRVRFPEFEGDGEWEKIELGDLVTIKGRIGYRGYTKDDIVAKGEGAISMSPSNINDQGTLSFEKSTYITWDKYYESPEIMLEDGFTVLVKTGSTFGKVAFISNLNEKTTINPQLVVLKPNGIDKYFLYLIVSNTSVQKQITATVVGGAIPTLSQDSISKFEVMVPRHDEQQKISSCLSALDELITAQQEKIAQLQQHKKGLMQGLFPKIES